jgi:pSer/pThr/pTyr-binding forkhead associated (FHA) protein
MGIKLRARFDEEGSDSPPFFEGTIDEDRITIGNDPTSTIRLNGSVVSAEQVVIIDDAAGATLVNREEGTALNGEMLAANTRRPLRSGDVLSIGSYRIKVYLQLEPASEKRYELVVVNTDSTASGAVEQDSTEDRATTLTASQSEPSPVRGETRAAPTKSFAAILDSLRTDEDRFYFVVEGGPQVGLRVPLESTEAPVGWDETGEQITFAPPKIASLCAVIRKDWSGVLLEAQTPTSVAVNGAPVEGTRRLRDGDRVLFSRNPGADERVLQVMLVFREPASLVILDSVIPRATPIQAEPILLAAENEARSEAVRAPAGLTTRVAALFRSNREYFGAFTFLELVLMAVGTLIGAVIIFLILNSS